MKRFLGRLLHLANSDVPLFGNEQFYAIKERMLREWGTRDGEDWQHIRKECWTCHGTGIFSDFGYPLRCNRCTRGVYDEKWIRLERWRLGGYVFHRPAETYHCSEPPWAKIGTDRPFIEGRIEHKVPGRRGHEAALWLALIFDPPYWLRLMTGNRCGEWTGLPMCELQKVMMEVCMLCASLVPRDCISCGDPFVRPFTGSIHYQCRRCAERPRPVWTEDEVQF
jgi:hypothetical protein